MYLLSRTFFFFNDTATTEIYTLSLHDALPIYRGRRPTPTRSARPSGSHLSGCKGTRASTTCGRTWARTTWSTCSNICGSRSEEHTSELQSRQYLVCRLLLEKKKKTHKILHITT